MVTNLFLKTIASRLSAGGACPVDRHCVHAGIARCEASAEILKQKQSLLVAETIRKEHRRPCVCWMEQHKDTNQRWPCNQKIWTILLPQPPKDVYLQ